MDTAPTPPTSTNSNAAGDEISSFPVRLDQVSASGLQAPVSKGVDSNYALYDGWFYTQGGPGSSVPSDNFPLATSDPSGFYFYQSFNEGGSGGGSCQGAGDEVSLSSFTPNPFSDAANWTDFFYLSTCGSYPPQLLAATSGNGLVAALFSGEAYATSEGDQYSGSNPYLLMTGQGGNILYEGEMGNNDYLLDAGH